MSKYYINTANENILARYNDWLYIRINTDSSVSVVNINTRMLEHHRDFPKQEIRIGDTYDNLSSLLERLVIPQTECILARLENTKKLSFVPIKLFIKEADSMSYVMHNLAVYGEQK